MSILDKTNIIKFLTKNLANYTVYIGYEEKYIEKMANTKFLGLKIANHLNCKKNDS